MKRPQTIALCVTAAVVVLLVLLLTLGQLRFDRATLPVPPRPTAALIQDEEFVELFSPEPMQVAPSEASPAYNPEPADGNATPAPVSGDDVHDAGAAGEAVPPQTSSRPSPVKSTPAAPPVKPGPSQEDIRRQQEEEARRRATAQLQNAFQNTQGQNYTQNTGRQDGNAGNPSGSASAQNGHGTGRVNGGWKMPSYAKVPSSVTGTIELRATVNRSGLVTDVVVVGGQAPAATNSALVEACKAEVKRRKFTRSDDNAPETATAYITYRFN